MVDVREGIGGDRCSGDTRCQHHQRTEEIGDQRDAEGGGPASHVAGNRSVEPDLEKEDGAENGKRARAEDADLTAQQAIGRRQEHQTGRDHGREDRGDEKPAHAASLMPITSAFL